MDIMHIFDGHYDYSDGFVATVVNFIVRAATYTKS